MATRGERLGPYELIEPIGRGGMGEVWRARDTRLARDVALKLLHGCAEDELVRRFEREARAAAALAHPGIVAVHDVGQAGGRPYIVSELLQGETLRARLSRGALAPAEVASMGAQLLRALSAAHERGVVHRDLKPENVFLTNKGEVKLLDFGLAKLRGPLPLDGATAPGTLMGTIGYMAPEQICGGEADASADLFSAGALLYEMALGERAFAGPTPAAAMNATLTGEPPRLRDLPPALAKLVRGCLQKDAARRPASAAALAARLEALPAKALRRPRRLPFRAAAVLFCAIVLLGGAALRGMRRGGETELPPWVAPRAVKSYLDGQKAFKRGDYRGAEQAFLRATQEDPRFVQASFRLATVAPGSDHPGLAHDALSLARDRASSVPERDRAVFSAYADFLEGRARAGDRKLTAWLASHPDDAEALNWLGEVRFAYAPALVMGGLEEARAPLERAVSLDRDLPETFERLAEMDVARGDRASARAHAEAALARLDPNSSLHHPARWMRAWAMGDEREQEKLLQELLVPGDSSWSWTTNITAVMPDAAPLLRRIHQLAMPDLDDKQHRRWSAGIIAAILGQRRLAQQILGKPDELPGAMGHRAALWLLSLPPLAAPPAEVRAAREELAEAAMPDVKSEAMRSFLSGLLSLRLDDLGAVRSAAAALRAQTPIPRSSSAADLAEVLDAHVFARSGQTAAAWAALSRVQGEPARSGGQLDRGLLGPTALLLRGDLLEADGRDGEALQLYAGNWQLNSPPDLPLTAELRIRRGLLLEKRGDLALAAEQYGIAVELWRDCDPEVVPRRELAERRRLAILQRH